MCIWTEPVIFITYVHHKYTSNNRSTQQAFDSPASFLSVKILQIGLGSVDKPPDLLKHGLTAFVKILQ